MKAFAEALEGLDVARVAVFHPVFHVSTTVFVQALREALRTARVTATVVGGSRSHFTELNREGSRLPDDLAALVVTVTPLFHALSTAQLIESVTMQRLVAQQTVSYADGLPVHVGPVTLRPRFNDVATGPQPAPGRSDLSEGYGRAVHRSHRSAPETAGARSVGRRECGRARQSPGCRRSPTSRSGARAASTTRMGGHRRRRRPCEPCPT